QPDLVGRVAGALGREGLHVAPDRRVVGRSGQPPDHGARQAGCVAARWTPWGVHAARDTGYRAALARWPARRKSAPRDFRPCLGAFPPWRDRTPDRIAAPRRSWSGRSRGAAFPLL